MKVILRQDNYGFSGMMYSGVMIWDSKDVEGTHFFEFDNPIQNKEEAYQATIINFFTNKFKK